MKAVFCPECERRLKLGAHTQVGQQIVCAGCKTKLEIVSTAPLTVDLPVQRKSKKQRTKAVVAMPCPECDADIRLGTIAREGQPVSCPTCKAELEVVSLDPLELETAA